MENVHRVTFAVARGVDPAVGAQGAGQRKAGQKIVFMDHAVGTFDAGHLLHVAHGLNALLVHRRQKMGALCEFILGQGP